MIQRGSEGSKGLGESGVSGSGSLGSPEIGGSEVSGSGGLGARARALAG